MWVSPPKFHSPIEMPTPGAFSSIHFCSRGMSMTLSLIHDSSLYVGSHRARVERSRSAAVFASVPPPPPFTATLLACG